MTALKTLVLLEYSHSSSFRRGKFQRILVALSVFGLLLLCGLYLPGPKSSERSPFIYAALLLWMVTAAYSSLSMLMFMGQSHREWILGFPHSRLKLLYAKGICQLKHCLNITLPVLAAAIALYGISVFADWYNPLPVPELIYMLVAYTLFILAFLPLAIVFGLAISLLVKPGKLTLLLLIPYTLLWILPFIIDSILVTSYSGMQSLEFSSPGYVLVGAFALCLIGWPAVYLLMPVIANKGLKAAAGTRGSSSASSSGRSRLSRAKKHNSLTGHASPFVTLYRLNTSRVRRIEKHPVIVILKVAVPLLVATASYYGSAQSPDILNVAKSLFMLPVLFSSLWMMSRSSIERKQLPWFLGFPLRRMTVLLAGVAGVWVTAMRIITVLGLSFLAGTVIGFITGKGDLHNLSYALSWLFFSYLVYTLALTLTVSLLQAEYYLTKSTALTFLMFPLVMLGPMHSFLINKFMMPAEFRSGVMPDWGLLGWVAVIGLPLAACSIYAGAKYYHLCLTPQKKTAAQTKQA